jgi:hypothetical protein
MHPILEPQHISLPNPVYKSPPDPVLQKLSARQSQVAGPLIGSDRGLTPYYYMSDLSGKSIWPVIDKDPVI